MAQKVQHVNHESRIFDFIYDPTYTLSARDFEKAESVARSHFLSARNGKGYSLDLNGLLTVRPLFTTDHRAVLPTEENGTKSSNSVVLQGRQSPRYVSSVNRYKFYSAPVSASDRHHKTVSLTKPVLNTPVQTPLIPDERPMKNDLELSLRSSSSGYHSVRSQPVPTSAKVQAIIERLYHGHQPGRQCSQCSYGWPTGDTNDQTSSLPQSPSLPQVNTKDIELVESMRAKRRLGRHNVDHARSMESLHKSPVIDPSPSAVSSNSRRSSPRRYASPVRTKHDDYQHVDHLRQKLAAHTDHLRREIEEKLKRMRVRHERALQRLQNENKPRVTVDSSDNSSNGVLLSTPKMKPKRSKTKENFNSKNVVIQSSEDVSSAEYAKSPSDKGTISPSPNQETSETTPVLDVYSKKVNEDVDVNDNETKLSDPKVTTCELNVTSTTVAEDLVDASTVQDEIIKPLVDYIISESIMTLANYRANEDVSLKLTNRKPMSVVKDVNEFVSKDLLPSSINLVHQVLLQSTTH